MISISLMMKWDSWKDENIINYNADAPHSLPNLWVNSLYYFLAIFLTRQTVGKSVRGEPANARSYSLRVITRAR